MDLASRATYRGQVTKIVKSASEFLKLNDGKVIGNADASTLDSIEEELSVFLDRLSAAHESLRKANADVLPSIKSEEFEKESDTIADYNDKAIATITRLKMRLTKVRDFQKTLSAANVTSNDTSANHVSIHDVINSPINKPTAVRLQKLHPKKFSGDYKEWIPFWEQYRTLVHDNPALSKVDKFNYLEAALIGKAANTLMGLTPSELNYDSAIALLKNEYGNTDKIIDHTMQSLLSIQPVHSRVDSAGLRELYNSVLASTRSLEAHGISSSNYFVMLKSVLLRCIPNELRVDFHRYYDDISDELPQTVAEDDNVSLSTKTESSSTIGVSDKQVRCLLKFLKREVESLEKANEAKQPLNRIHSSHVIKPKPKTAVGLFAAEGEELSCFFCKAAGHTSEDCKSSKTIMEKKKMLKEDGRCYRCLRKGHYSKVCKKRFKLVCKICNRRHATSMCDPQFNVRNTAPVRSSKPVSNSQQSINLYTSSAQNSKQNNEVYLQTAFAFASNTKLSHSLYVRIVIDGGSQMSFVKSSVVRQLNLPIVGVHHISIIPFGSKEPKPSTMCNKVRLRLRSQYDHKEIVVDMIEVPEICIDVLPTPGTNIDAFNELLLADIPLDDVEPVSGISVLIGADNYWKFATGEYKRITPDLAAIHTILGWTLQGRSPVAADCSTVVSCTTSLHVGTCACEDMQQFWRLEALGITNEETVSTAPITSVHRVGDRFEASLPWKNTGSMLHDNRTGSFYRMHALVRKLRANGKLKEYEAAMSEMVNSGVAEPAEECSGENRVYYMPHRPVFRDDKDTTKLRIVFNASAHANNHLSLNDHLEVGKNLLPDILIILLNFRCGKFALTADIEKAFLQILLSSADRDCHRFFWFKELISSNEIRTNFIVQPYRMTRVTFGVTCSPSLLGTVIQKILDEEEHRHPEVVAILRKGFYVDDFVASVNSEETASYIVNTAVEIMKSGSMHLRKWNSNSVSIRNQLLSKYSPPENQKILGMRWYVNSDELAVDLSAVETIVKSEGLNGTKRNVLRIMSKIYDPFGLLGPWVVRWKVLFPSLWRRQLSWDERLPQELEKIWLDCCQEVGVLKQLMIPRCVFKEVGSTQVHIYADASQCAFGAVAYLRTCDEEGKVCVRFLCAKNRIAPIKNSDTNELTLPKLELTAALVAARLLDYLRINLQIKFCEEFLWTDSKIVMFWILGTQKKWRPYVDNRVREIRRLSKISSWRHCPGSQNPADLITRGINASSLLNSELWLSGPSWLQQEANYWPSGSEENTTSLSTFSLLVEEEKGDIKPANIHHTLMDCTKFSSWRRLLRVTAYCFRVINKFKSLHRDEMIPPNNSPFVTANEIDQAEIYWIKEAQQQYFHLEIAALQQNNGIPLNSKLLILNPFLDPSHKFLRVGGRLHLLQSTIEAHPIILPKMSHITKLIVVETHEQLIHAGVSAVMTRLRGTYWIGKCRQLVRSVVKNCTVCRVLQAKPASQPFAPLPRERIVFSMPFNVTGLDFAGPLYTYESDQKKKVYIMLFTCAAIRAVHLELTPDLSTESCILALRRFIARRGVPRVIWSDNAANFKKTSKELSNLANEKFDGFLSNHRISWRFIAERAPWWGGFWERLVGVVKTSLRAAVGKATLSSDQLYTLLTEVENVVNSRPLTYVADDPLDLSPLTPSQLLRGPEHSPQMKDMTEQKEHTSDDLRKKWKERLIFTSCFKRRWYTEYLQQLRSFHSINKTKSINLSIGDVVIMEDRSLPKTLWRLGVIVNVFPGRDGKVRACEVRLSNGSVFRRPVQLLYPLEISRSLKSSGPEDVENK